MFVVGLSPRTSGDFHRVQHTPCTPRTQGILAPDSTGIDVAQRNLRVITIDPIRTPQKEERQCSSRSQETIESQRFGNHGIRRKVDSTHEMLPASKILVLPPVIRMSGGAVQQLLCGHQGIREITFLFIGIRHTRVCFIRATRPSPSCLNLWVLNFTFTTTDGFVRSQNANVPSRSHVEVFEF